MEYFPAPLEKLVEQFARLPGIGSKSAQRLAFHVLNLPMEQAQEFANAIVEANFDVSDVAQLPWQAAGILVLVSMGLTALAGLIPASAASRKDPVEALRSE